MMDYPALAAVAAVVRARSFERAAESLGVTPSAVSQRIRALEERLGGIVVVRGQPCVPTELGRKLCAHMDKVRLLEADLTPVLFPGGARMDKPVTLRVAVNSDSIATWFPKAAAAFTQATGYLLEFLIEDETLTAERLRSGEVIAAVSADPGGVQGCRTIALGGLRYLACCSPSFAERHFPEGVTHETLRLAPWLRFDPRDELQARWAYDAYGVELACPPHWVPSTSGFVTSALAGMAWGMQPMTIAQPLIERGDLVEMKSGASVTVELYWTITRLHVSALRMLTDAVRDEARVSLYQ